MAQNNVETKGGPLMECTYCGDEANLVRDDSADTGHICFWCLQHPESREE
jgi:hypothetical protein